MIKLSSSYYNTNTFEELIQIANNNDLTFDQLVEKFESQLEKYLGNKSKVTSLNSGTSAIHLALILAGVSCEDEVICQSMTFVASAFPIIYLGAKPIFVDSEFKTWNMCPEYLEEAIKDRIVKGKKPKAIIVVHLYGMPAQMDKITDIAKAYKITLIEDAAEALGSSFRGQKCGTIGDYGILSFNINKVITTFGGGALLSKNIECVDKAIYLASQAKDEAPHYQHSQLGYNYRMSNILAGIGIEQMKLIDKHIGLRRYNNSFYSKLFENKKGITFFSEPSNSYFSNHWLSAVIIDVTKTGFTREDLRLRLDAANIEARPLWKPMHMQPVFKDAPYYGAKVSEELFDKGLCLPSGSNLTNTDRGRIEQVISAMF